MLRRILLFDWCKLQLFQLNDSTVLVRIQLFNPSLPQILVHSEKKSKDILGGGSKFVAIHDCCRLPTVVSGYSRSGNSSVRITSYTSVSKIFVRQGHDN